MFEWRKKIICNTEMLRKQVRYLQPHFHPSKIYRKIYILDSCHLIYLFIFCHGKEKVKMKRKAVGKLCEPRHQKRILHFAGSYY